MSTTRTIHLKWQENDREQVCPPEAHQPISTLETDELFGMTDTEMKNILRKAVNCRNE